MKITRRELRQIIAEAGSFEAPGINPLSTAEVMDMIARGEDVEGVEAPRADMSYQTEKYIPTIKRAHTMIKGLQSELTGVQFGNADETALVRNEIKDAVTSLGNVLRALGVVEAEHKDMGGMVGKLARGSMDL